MSDKQVKSPRMRDNGGAVAEAPADPRAYAGRLPDGERLPPASVRPGPGFETVPAPDPKHEQDRLFDSGEQVKGQIGLDTD